MIKGMAHVCLLAKDLDAAERFYCNGLGLKKTFDFISDGRVVGFYLQLSQGVFIEIFERAEIAIHADNPIQHFCIEVDDIDQIGERLIGNGYEATKKMLGADHSWQLWTTDPSGARIEFHQYTDRSTQITRENCFLK